MRQPSAGLQCSISLDMSLTTITHTQGSVSVIHLFQKESSFIFSVSKLQLLWRCSAIVDLFLLVKMVGRQSRHIHIYSRLEPIRSFVETVHMVGCLAKVFSPQLVSHHQYCITPRLITRSSRYSLASLDELYILISLAFLYLLYLVCNQLPSVPHADMIAVPLPACAD